MDPLRSGMAARPAAVAGLFYPADEAALRAHIDSLLDASDRGDVAVAPKMVMVPHAGTVYSGAVAASAYARLRGSRASIRRVVLIGPAHRVAFRGLAAPGVSAFDTPLGQVPLDRVRLADLGEAEAVVRDDAAHADEHALEVQLPFLQRVLDQFVLVPLLAGDVPPVGVARVLERIWGGPETLIVVSSDLSHYLPYEEAQAVDRATTQQIQAMDPGVDVDQACGAVAINGALMVARASGLAPRLLDVRNSGDATGDRRRVVGYGAFAFEPPP
jgi:MEMO1 family protein